MREQPNAMKKKPHEKDKNLGRDLDTFDHIPVNTRELHVLTDQAEKSVGGERADLDRLILKKSKQASPRGRP
jgi:hypothetical protein